MRAKAALILLLVLTGAKAWQNESYNYRTNFTITNPQAETLNDYAINLTINTQTLISQGKMQNDCGDILFYDNEGNQYYYWVHNCNSASTDIWVNTRELTASQAKNFSMYYGNPEASNEFINNETALTVTGTTNIDSIKTPLAFGASQGENSILSSSATGFSVGDEIIIMEMKGTNAGTYEYNKITGISTNTLNLFYPTRNAYTTAGKAVIQKVKHYPSVTVNSGGQLTASTWNGATGGIIAFRAGTITVNSGGSINATSKGYLGGISGTQGAENSTAYITTGGGGGGGGAPGWNYPPGCSASDRGLGADGAADGFCSTEATTGCTLRADGTTSSSGGAGITGGGGGGAGSGYVLGCGGTATDGGGVGGIKNSYGYAGASGSTGGGGGGAGGRDCGGAGGGGKAMNSGINNAPNDLNKLILGPGASAGAGGGGGGGSGETGYPVGGGGGGSKIGTGGARGADTCHNNATAGTNGANGGQGGGIILIQSKTLNVNGQVISQGGIGGKGGDGGNGSGSGCATFGGFDRGGGAGGGGSGGNGGAGGSIYLTSNTLSIGTNLVTVPGGVGGSGGIGGLAAINSGPGGAGAAGSSGTNGKVRLDYNSLTGSTTTTKTITLMPTAGEFLTEESLTENVLENEYGCKAQGFTWMPNSELNSQTVNGLCCGDDVIDLRKGLVSEWHLDEGSGSTVYDNISSSHGTLTNMDPGTDWVTGKYGSALDFDGSDDYVNIGNLDAFNFERTSTYSINAWVKTTSVTGGGIIAKIDPGTSYRGYDMFLLTDGTIRAHLINTYPSNLIIVDSTKSINDGSWHQVIITYDGSSLANGLKIYIDGTLDNLEVQNDALSATTLNTVALKIGSRENTQYFSGQVDEVRIYNRALNDNEISYLYEMSPYAYINYTDNFHNGTIGVDSSYCVAGDYYTELDDSPLYCSLSGNYYIKKDWLLEGFKYKKNITISSSSALTDYQIPINPTTYNTTGLVISYHFSEQESSIKDYSGINNYGTLYGSTIGLWHFDEGVGTSSYDSTIYSNTFTLSNDIRTTGISEKALSFTGSNWASVSGTNFNFAKDDNFTVSFWLKRNSLTAHIIMEKWDNAGGGYPFVFRCSTTEDSCFMARYDGTNNPSVGAYADYLNNWHHIVGVKAGKTLLFYIDGILVSTAVDTTTGTTTNAYPLYLARRGNGLIYDIGIIDELAIYNKSLTDEQVEYLYNSQKAQFIEYVEGYEGKGVGLEFGNKTYVNTNKDLSWSNSQSFSMSVWFNPDQITEGASIMGKLSNWEWELVQPWSNPDSLSFIYYNTGGYGGLSLTASDFLTPNKWYNAVIVYNATITTAYLYINNELKATSVISGTLVNRVDNVYIGYSHHSSTTTLYYFKGTIDEVLVYNRALSVQEVSELYNERYGRLDYADLRFYNASGTELNYYHEYDNTTWVKVPSIPSGTSNITMYYGNPNAVSKSNGELTFEFFDDFDKDLLDSSKWGYTGNPAISQGFLTLNADEEWVESRKNFPYATTFETLVKSPGAALSTFGLIQDRSSHHFGSGFTEPSVDFNFWASNYIYSERADSDGGAENYYHDYSNNELFVCKINWIPSSYAYYQTCGTIHGCVSRSDTTSSYMPDADDNLRVILSNDNTIGINFDWVRVRKYTSTEPTITAQGEEYIHGNSTGLIAHYTFDNDIDNKTIDSIGKNTGSLYGSTVALWHFDEGAGSQNQVIDSSSYANHGTFNGGAISFASTGTTTWTVPEGVTEVEVLIVAGGGAGGASGAAGGGGAGGLIHETNYKVSPGQQISLTVGGGGATQGSNGLNSTFNSLIAIGGGGGSAVKGLDGGSGGGSGRSAPSITAKGFGTYGQGNDGGTAGYYTSQYPASGGGGAGSVGQSVLSGSPGTSGAGGNGKTINITGSTVTYAGGGGGGGDYYGGRGLAPGAGGSGGGGAGGNSVDGNGIAGTANTGGGGGGATQLSSGATGSGGAGGSGIIIVRPTKAEGMSGTGLKFDGVNDYINIINNPALNPTKEITVSAWIKTPTPEKSFQMIVSKDGSYELRFNGVTKKVHLGINIGGVFIDQTEYLTNTQLNADTWYHVLGSYNGTGVSVFINGIYDGGYSVTGSITTSANSLTIGSRGADYYFNGTIDEVAIYNKSLTHDEINNLYNSKRAKFMESVSGSTGKGIEFNGIDNYIKIPDNNFNFTSQQGLTLSGWIKLYSSQSNKGLIGDYYSSAGTMLWIYPENKLNYDFNTQYSGTGGATLPVNTWVHVALTWDKTNYATYLNGVLDLSGTVSAFTDGVDFQIGTYGGTTSFNGTMDDVRVYNRALSPTEISELYTSTASNYGCCGDDLITDNFYNNTLSTTKHFCYLGNYFNQATDTNQTLCENYGYDWINSTNHYLGVYTFIDDEVGSVPEGLTIVYHPLLENFMDNANAWLNVSESFNNHEKIINASFTGEITGMPEVWTFGEQPNFSTGTETVEWWMASTALTRNSLDTDTKCGFLFSEYSVLISTNAQFQVRHDGDEGNNQAFIINGTDDVSCGSFNPNQWYHYKLEINKDTNMATLYRDGSMSCSILIPSTITKIDTSLLVIDGGHPSDNCYIDAYGATYYPESKGYYIGKNQLRGSCCGDDGINDNFNNETVICSAGELLFDPDMSESTCLSQGHKWLTGTTYGINNSCCGNDISPSPISSKDHNCVLRTNGNVYCWGRNIFGQANPYTGGDAIAVAVGSDHTCVLKNNSNVDCYGNSNYGQAADYNGGDAVGITAGVYHTCVLKSNGNVDCYGYNNYGQAADYNGGDAVSVSAGLYHTCVLKSNGNVDCYGYNNYGQSADYTGGDAVSVKSGYLHNCLLKINGDIHCWGYSSYGLITNIYNGGDAVSISLGSYHSCALKSNGNVTCWGYNVNGESNPYNGGDANIVSAGISHTCVLRNNGNVTCWGQNADGKINNYTSSDAFVNNEIFYNSSMACYQGILTTNKDAIQGFCEINDFTWMIGNLTGSKIPCCGDDGINDKFYTGTINNTQNVCAYGVYSNQSLDYNKTSCEALGYAWINSSSHGLIAHWNLDDDTNKTLDDSGINHGTLYGNTLGLWRFNEGTGSTTKDETSYNNKGTITGATWNTSGKSSNALSFDGSGDYVSIPDSNSLDFTNKISISAWVYQNIANTNNGIVYKGSFSGSQGVYSLIFDTSPSKLRFRLNGQITEGSGQVTSVSSFSTGQWYHVVATYDGAYQRVYINGLLDNSASYSTLISVDSNPLYLGAYYSTTYALNGKLDEVAIYNKTLTQDEVTSLYNAGKAKFIEYKEGKYGIGVEFNGISDYINVPDSNTLDIIGQITLSAWIKPSLTSSYAEIFTKGNAGTVPRNYGLYTHNKKIHIQWYNGAYCAPTDFTGDYLIDNDWNHVLVTIDDSNIAKLYINGSYKEQLTGTCSLITNDYSLHIGGCPTCYMFNGTIDDIRVYNRALTSDEVMAIYQGSAYSDCCGDDGASDTFFNSTLNTTTYFCNQGAFINQEIDASQTVCNYYGYGYFTGTITGTEYPRCCGDDLTLDNFNNGTNICLEGASYIEYDLSQIACESMGYKWLTGEISGNTTLQRCCGDDGAGENFYNGTLSNTTYFCQDGIFTNQWIDVNETICNQYIGSWFNKSYYPATYLSDDINGGLPEYFTPYTPLIFGQEYDMKISNEFEGHNSILNISTTATESSMTAWFIGDQPSFTTGTQELEFWLLTDELNSGVTGIIMAQESLINPGSGFDIITVIHNGDGEVKLRHGTSEQVIATYTPMKWHHYRLIVNMDAKEATVYMDGNRLITTPFYSSVMTEINSAGIFVQDGLNGDIIYYDSIGYSWKGYNQGINHVPRCCGDDELSDNFYNETLSKGTNFCALGNHYYHPLGIDNNQTICEHYGNTWLNNASYERIYTFNGNAIGNIPSEFNYFLDNPDVQVNISESFNGRKKVVNASYLTLTTSPEAWGLGDQPSFSSGIYSVEFYFATSNLSTRGASPHAKGSIAFANLNALMSGRGLTFYQADWDGEDNIVLDNGTDYVVAGYYTPNQWTKYKLELNMDEMMANLYINDVLNVSIKIPAENTVINTFAFLTQSGEPGDFIYLDDVKINFPTNAGASCCGDDIGEDFVNGSLKCCCNSEIISTGDVCDTDQDYLIESVCDNEAWCDSSNKPEINLSSKVITSGSVEINVTSECQPNIIIIHPNLTETQLSTSTCGTNCYTTTFTSASKGYYHVQAFNGEYNYAMLLVKNESLIWNSLWETPQGELYRYRKEIAIKHEINHSRINQLVSIPVTFNETMAYCEDTNTDGHYTTGDYLGIRLANKLPNGELYDTPFTLTNAICSNNNLTSATINFALNMPSNASPFIGEGNNYYIYYGPFRYDIPSYESASYEDGFNRKVNTTQLEIEYSLTNNLTLTLKNYLSNSEELQATGDYIMEPISYERYDDRIVTLRINGTSNYTIKPEQAYTQYLLEGLIDDQYEHIIIYDQKYIPNSYYLISSNNLTSYYWGLYGFTRNWVKEFELKINTEKFTTITNGTHYYEINTPTQFNYDNPIILFNNITGEGLAVIRINSTSYDVYNSRSLFINERITYEPGSGIGKLNYYNLYRTGPEDTEVYSNSIIKSDYAITAFNYSNHNYMPAQRVFEWMNNTINYTITDAGVSFDIVSYTHDSHVDQSDEMISINASVYSNTEDITALHSSIRDSTGNLTLSENYECITESNYLYECKALIDPKNFNCGSYTAEIYGVGVTGNTTSTELIFEINDIIGNYEIPNDTLITTSQQAIINYQYCIENTSPSNINLELRMNNELIQNTTLNPTGSIILNYTNPIIPATINFTINASDEHYYDIKTKTANIHKSTFVLNTERRAYARGTSGYKSNFVTIINPTSTALTYNLGLVPYGIIARFSETKKNSASITLSPYSTETILIDVFPVTIGNYAIVINAASQVAADNKTLNFQAVVQTQHSSGAFTYTLVPATDLISILLMLLIAVGIILKKK